MWLCLPGYCCYNELRMIFVSEDISIHENSIRFLFTTASGPGGQKVNKTSSAVQLRFDVKRSPALPEDVRSRLMEIAGNRLTGDGELIIEANRYRTQEQNRQDAIERLVALIRQAEVEPKVRKPTKPSTKSKTRRLEEKRRHSETKRLRSSVPYDDE